MRHGSFGSFAPKKTNKEKNSLRLRGNLVIHLLIFLLVDAFVKAWSKLNANQFILLSFQDGVNSVGENGKLYKMNRGFTESPLIAAVIYRKAYKKL